MQFYKTLEECYEHSSDELCELIKCIKDILEYDEDEYIEECYAILYLALIDRRLNYESSDDYWCWENEYINTKFHLPLSTEDKLIINNVMHVLHTQYTNLRDNIKVYLAEHKQYFNEIIAYPSYKGCVLTGKSTVPDEWQDEIRRVCADLDVAITYIGTTWYYSHLDCGDDFIYDIPENIEVYIYGDNIKELELAKDRIEKLEFIYSKR